MTSTTAPPAAPAGTRRDARLYQDLHGILGIVQVTPGLPRWSVCEDLAAFFFAGLPADDVPQAFRDAETVLAYAFGAVFETRRPEPVGSTRHFIRTAELPSGLKVELVALAGTVNEADYREDAPQLVSAA
jgi:hypothetical protein